MLMIVLPVGTSCVPPYSSADFCVDPLRRRIILSGLRIRFVQPKVFGGRDGCCKDSSDFGGEALDVIDAVSILAWF